MKKYVVLGALLSLTIMFCYGSSLEKDIALDLLATGCNGGVVVIAASHVKRASLRYQTPRSLLAGAVVVLGSMGAVASYVCFVGKSFKYINRLNK